VCPYQKAMTFRVRRVKYAVTLLTERLLATQEMIKLVKLVKLFRK